jgi:hypothetical protein
MQSKAQTVRQYLAELPPDRRAAISAIRDVILKNLPKGYEEGMSYGMIGYHVPHSIYAAGYHCNPQQPLPFACLAAQKNHLALYLMCLYGDPEFEAWFRAEWAKTGKKLDAGKSCIRFKSLDDVPLALIGRAIKKVPVKKLIAFYEHLVPAEKRGTGRAQVGPGLTLRHVASHGPAAAHSTTITIGGTRPEASKPNATSAATASAGPRTPSVITGDQSAASSTPTTAAFVPCRAAGAQAFARSTCQNGSAPPIKSSAGRKMPSRHQSPPSHGVRGS